PSFARGNTNIIERKERIWPKNVEKVSLYIIYPSPQAIPDCTLRVFRPCLKLCFKRIRPKSIALFCLICNKFLERRIDTLEKARAETVKCLIETCPFGWLNHTFPIA